MNTISISLVFSHLLVAWITWYVIRFIHLRKTLPDALNDEQINDDLRASDLQERLTHLNNLLASEALEKEHLKKQLKQKAIELAKQVKDGEDKNRVLKLLREKLNEAEYNPKINKAYWSEMDRLLSIHLENNDKGFELQMDELHQEFITKLHKEYGDLSVYDLRLCAYLKIGMNSKEISELLRVLPSSINVSRSRIRKKLGLRPDEDLFHVLNNF